MPGSVLRIELQREHGDKPTATSKVQVLYVGRLADDSVFDESAEPQWLRLDSAITGWRTALQEMLIDAKWRLVTTSTRA